MMKARKKGLKKVICSIRTGIVAAGMAAVICMPQIAGAAWEIDNTRMDGWYHGMASVAERERKAEEQEASLKKDETMLSKVMYSDEKSLYDILKKMTQQDK